MVAQENWSSFHHKYSSKEFKRSADFDRERPRESGVRGLLTRKNSSRMLQMESKATPVSTERSSLMRRTSSKDISTALIRKGSVRKLSFEDLQVQAQKSSRSSLTKNSSSRDLSLSLHSTHCNERATRRNSTIARGA